MLLLTHKNYIAEARVTDSSYRFSESIEFLYLKCLLCHKIHCVCDLQDPALV